MPFDLPSQSILRQLLLGKSREEITQQLARERAQTRWSDSSSSQSSNSPVSDSNKEATDVPNVTSFGDPLSHTGHTQLNSSAHGGYFHF